MGRSWLRGVLRQSLARLSARDSRYICSRFREPSDMVVSNRGRDCYRTRARPVGAKARLEDTWCRSVISSSPSRGATSGRRGWLSTTSAVGAIRVDSNHYQCRVLVAAGGMQCHRLRPLFARHVYRFTNDRIAILASENCRRDITTGYSLVYAYDTAQSR